MPLIHSPSRAAVGTNIKEMEAAGHPQKQAIAAALHNARQYGAHFAGGGFTAPAGQRQTERHALTSGFLHSSVPGRTDKLPITVGGGAYVLPADHVAAIGQGNSLAGADKVGRMFKMGPYGTPAGGMKTAVGHTQQPKLPGIKQPNKIPGANTSAEGGSHHGHEPVSIIAAGGEIVIPPEKVIEKYGSLEKGHKELDGWVIRERKKHIKTLRNLKPPKHN